MKRLRDGVFAAGRVGGYRGWVILWAAMLAASGGCTDLSQKWELDHARVLAVRLSSPGLAAGDAAVVEVLVADDQGVPAVVAPASVAVSSTTEPALQRAITLSPTAGGWTVAAASSEALAQMRVAAGLEPDQPLQVQLELEVQVGGRTLRALKAVRLGAAIPNPATPTISVDGAAQAAEASVSVGRTVSLSIDAPELAQVDWLTSTGTLSGSETAMAKLEVAAGDPARGYVVVLVRTEEGGVGWATVALTVP
jgi:hypothetical protein